VESAGQNRASGSAGLRALRVVRSQVSNHGSAKHTCFSETFADSEYYSEDASTRTPATSVLHAAGAQGECSAGYNHILDLNLLKRTCRIAEVVPLKGGSHSMPTLVVYDPRSLLGAMMRQQSTHNRHTGYMSTVTQCLPVLMGSPFVGGWL